MANAYKDTIKFKVSAFQAIKLEDQPIEGYSGEKNCIIYIQEGNCTIDALGKEHKPNQHMLIYIARGIKYSLRAEKKDRCLLQMLELSDADKDPCLDLRDLCAKNPAIFSFMGSKSRCCLLIDCENMYSTMNELFGELEAEHPDKQQMIVAILTVLYIKMARSFRLHGNPSGVQYITEAKRYIAEHYNENLTVQLIADYLGISRSYLQILFKRYGKRSIVTHINGVRINKASYLLATTDISVLDIALSMGYNSRQHFTRAFHEHTGVSPREYRKHHAAIKGSKN